MIQRKTDRQVALIINANAWKVMRIKDMNCVAIILAKSVRELLKPAQNVIVPNIDSWKTINVAAMTDSTMMVPTLNARPAIIHA